MNIRLTLSAVTIGAFLALPAPDSHAFPLSGDDTVLPAGTELNEEALARPREVFRSEFSGGHKSYLVNLGDVAFNSPLILGGVARQAAMSCATCHVNGAGNAKLYIPGMSTRPGNFDTTGGTFNPKAFNSLRDPVRIPSLRGARALGPYGHDGRFASLRDFVRNVIVDEFAGPEPSPQILNALVAYIQDIDFLRNPRLGPGGRLSDRYATDIERQGEALFRKPFPRNPELSCAACHVPSGTFADHQQHDVGTGALVKTPTLLNANFNAPYFHDGRFDSYDEVVDHFDGYFELGLSASDKKALVAYLVAVGDAERPYEKDSVMLRMKEITDFLSVLEQAIPSRDTAVVSLVVATVGYELRELSEHFPDHRDAAADGGDKQRRAARLAVKDLILKCREIESAVSEGRFDDALAQAERAVFLAGQPLPFVLKEAEPWSLFNPAVHGKHYDALRQMLTQAADKGTH